MRIKPLVAGLLGALTALILLTPLIVILHQAFLFRPPFPRGILIGSTTPSSAKIWIRATHCESATLSLSSSSSPGSPPPPSMMESPITVTLSTSPPTSHPDIAIIPLSSLIPSTSYSISVTLDNCLTPSPPLHASFSTFSQPDDSSISPSTFLFGSCMTRTAFWPFNTVSLLDHVRESHAADLDFALLLGDLGYRDLNAVIAPYYHLDADTAYAQVWSDPAVRSLFQTLPSFAMFDDHEIANDYDSGPDTPLFVDAMQAFDAWIGVRNPEPLRQGSRYFAFNNSAASTSVFMVDTRSYRSPNDAPDGPGKTMLGDQQEADLKAWLLAHHNAGTLFKIIASPVSWSPHGDGGMFAHQISELLSFVADHNIQGVVILSGDTHWAAAYKHGHREPYVWECSASPFQALPFPDPAWIVGPDDPDSISETLFVSSLSFHFGVARTDPDLGLFSCDLYSYFPLLHSSPTLAFTHTHSVR